MKYALIKGAGLSAKDLRVVVIMYFDTLDPNWSDVKVFHEPVEKLNLPTLSDHTHNQILLEATRILQANEPLFGWNFLSYELKLLTDAPQPFIRDNIYDLFKVIHFEKNRMLSFYNIIELTADHDQQRMLHAATLGTEVKLIPGWIQAGQHGFVVDYLQRYLQQLNTFFQFWYNHPTIQILVQDREGTTKIQLPEIWQSLLAYQMRMRAIQQLPAYCLVESFR